jgi:hypothetical protein
MPLGQKMPKWESQSRNAKIILDKEKSIQKRPGIL